MIRFSSLHTFCNVFEFSVGIKHRFRHILRDPLKPQGQCYSKLNESISCYADACFTYTQRTLHDKNGFRKIQCIRLDGTVVEGKSCCTTMLFTFHCVYCFVLLYVIKLFCKCLFSIKSNYELRTLTSYPKHTKTFFICSFS